MSLIPMKHEENERPKAIFASNSAWPSASLTFNNIEIGASDIYHFVAKAPGTAASSVVDIYLIPRGDGVNTWNQVSSASNVSVTYNATTKILTINLGSSAYWSYAMTLLNSTR